jgi:hypothetical protein
MAAPASVQVTIAASAIFAKANIKMIEKQQFSLNQDFVSKYSQVERGQVIANAPPRRGMLSVSLGGNNMLSRLSVSVLVMTASVAANALLGITTAAHAQPAQQWARDDATGCNHPAAADYKRRVEKFSMAVLGSYSAVTGCVTTPYLSGRYDPDCRLKVCSDVHAGTDLRSRETPAAIVRSPVQGVVGFRSFDPPNGHSTLLIATADGAYKVLFLHMAEIFPKIGAPVHVGMELGRVGQVGTKDRHLHVEAWPKSSSLFVNRIAALTGSACRSGVCTAEEVARLTVDPVSVLAAAANSTQAAAPAGAPTIMNISIGMTADQLRPKLASISCADRGWDKRRRGSQIVTKSIYACALTNPDGELKVAMTWGRRVYSVTIGQLLTLLPLEYVQKVTERYGLPRNKQCEDDLIPTNAWKSGEHVRCTWNVGGGTTLTIRIPNLGGTESYYRKGAYNLLTLENAQLDEKDEQEAFPGAGTQPRF